jgi:tetratricopeptide (TPR) repeat protein
VNSRKVLRYRPIFSTGIAALGFFWVVAVEQHLMGLEVDASPGVEDVVANPDILKGIHLIYDRQFDDAEEQFRKIVAERPLEPAGYFYLAMVSWSRLASGFWSPSDVEEFKNRIDRAIETAEAQIGKKAPGSYDFFYLGGALGFKGRFELMKGEWLSSFFLATRAIDALKTCLGMDPSNKDVLLGIGTFDYYTARLSGVLKFLTYLLLHKGNKEEGLKKLNIAANEAIYSATESKSLLLHIYLFLEEDFRNSLLLSSELAKRYTENPRFKLLQGVSYIQLDMYPRYRETLDELRRKKSEASKRETAAMWERQALYLEAIYELFQGRYSEARSILTKILDDQDPVNDPSMIAWPLMKIGMSYDLEKNREKAMIYYNDVLNMENGSGAQFLATKLLQSPLNKGDPFIGY